MKNINIFVQQVLQDNTKSFEIHDGSRHYCFVQGRVKNAKYVYGEYSYYNEYPHASLYEKLKLVAIVANGIIYMVESMFLGFPNDSDKIINFSDYMKDIFEKIIQETTISEDGTIEFKVLGGLKFAERL